jgi:hypothetical protein
MSTTEEKIIYVVVAETVQHPLVRTISLPYRLVRLDETRTIVQIPGRLAAQACHAVRRMGHNMVINAVSELLTFNGIVSLKKLKQAIFSLRNLVTYQPITTIILSCRDSFELEHTYNLLRDHAGVAAYKFEDTNLDVYCTGCRQPCRGEVTTAFATVPVDKQEVLGYLDYLPLWTPKS